MIKQQEENKAQQIAATTELELLKSQHSQLQFKYESIQNNTEAKLRKEIEDLQEINRMLELQMYQLPQQSDIDSYNQIIQEKDAFQNDLLYKQQQLVESQEQIQKLIDQINVLSKDKEITELAAHQLVQQQKEQFKQIIQLKDDEISNINKELQSQKLDFDTQMNLIKEELATTTQQLSEQNNQLDDYQNQLKSVLNSQLTTNQQFESLQEKNDQFSQENAQLHEQLQTVQQYLDDFQLKYQKLELDSQQQHQEVQEFKQQLINENQQLQLELNDATQQIDQQKIQLSEKEAEVIENRQMLQFQTTDIPKYQQQILQQKEDYNILSQKLNDSDEQCTILKNQNIFNQEQLIKATNVISKQSEQLKQLNQLDELKRRITELSQENQTIVLKYGQIQQEQTKNKQLEQFINTAYSKINDIKSNQQENNELLSQVAHLIRIQQQKQQSKKISLDEIKSQISTVKNMLITLQNSLQQYPQILNSIQTLQKFAIQLQLNEQTNTTNQKNTQRAILLDDIDNEVDNAMLYTNDQDSGQGVKVGYQQVQSSNIFITHNQGDDDEEQDQEIDKIELVEKDLQISQLNANKQEEVQLLAENTQIQSSKLARNTSPPKKLQSVIEAEENYIKQINILKQKLQECDNQENLKTEIQQLQNVIQQQLNQIQHLELQLSQSQTEIQKYSTNNARYELQVKKLFENQNQHAGQIDHYKEATKKYKQQIHDLQNSEKQLLKLQFQYEELFKRNQMISNQNDQLQNQLLQDNAKYQQVQQENDLLNEQLQSILKATQQKQERSVQSTYKNDQLSPQQIANQLKIGNEYILKIAK